MFWLIQISILTLLAALLGCVGILILHLRSARRQLERLDDRMTCIEGVVETMEDVLETDPVCLEEETHPKLRLLPFSRR